MEQESDNDEGQMSLLCNIIEMSNRIINGSIVELCYTPCNIT